MTRWGLVLLLLVSGVSCIEARTVPCGDQLCPVGDVCTAGGCATVEAQDACAGKNDGEACSITANPLGSCNGGSCQDPVCGNGVVDATELCDDGNELAGDGCAAACNSDEVCGNALLDLAVGEECDLGIAGLSGDGCTSGCGRELASWMDVSPTAVPGRGGGGMAYDVVRDRMVLFGGAGYLGHLGDTWEWDGATWSRRAMTYAPPARTTPLVYDEARGVVLLFGGNGVGGFYGDTWQWDGVVWTQLAPPASPSARSDHALIYDRARGRVVLVGGRYTTTLFADTWEWDGVTWTERIGINTPTPGYEPAFAYDEARERVVLYHHQQTWEYDGLAWIDRGVTPPAIESYGSMTYDAARAVTVLFGGFVAGNQTDQTWEWDGSSWAEGQASATEPPIRSAPVLAYDRSGQRTVMFGGFDYETSTEVLLHAETWTWQGQWSLVLALPVSPPRRREVAMAWDPLRGKSILFGGYSEQDVYLDDLWEWDDHGWRGRPAILRPSPRSGHAMTYDIARRRLVMFGGANDLGRQGDTWEWDGAAWAARATATSPTARDRAAIGYDAARGHTILFGGSSAPGPSGILGDTWRWDGTSWSQLSPTSSPPVRVGARMAYDPVRERLVLFGGTNTLRLADTWEWDGTTWIEGPSAPAAARVSHAMAYDAHRRHIIMFGGYGNQGIAGDTWQYDGTSWSVVATLATPTLRTSHAMTYDAVGRSVVMFGGEAYLGDYLDDTVRFQHASPFEAPERCLTSDDDFDDDGLAGCADPDCWGRCAPLCPPGAVCAAGAPRCGDGACGDVENPRLCPADCS